MKFKNLVIIFFFKNKFSPADPKQITPHYLYYYTPSFFVAITTFHNLFVDPVSL